MVEVHRIWRVGSADEAVHVGLVPTDRGGQQVSISMPGMGERAVDIDVAQAIAQAILEACEISSALGGITAQPRRNEVRVP